MSLLGPMPGTKAYENQKSLKELDAQRTIEKRRKAIEKRQKKFGTTGGYPSDYKKTEQEAREKAEAWQKAKSVGSEVLKRAVPKQGATESFGTLRYPYSTLNSNQDFIKFSIYNYRRGEGTITRNQDNLKAIDSSGRVKDLGHILLPIPSNLVDSNNAGWANGNMNFLQEAGFNIGRDAMDANLEGVGRTINNMVAQAVGRKDMIKDWFAMQAVNSIGGNLTFDQLLARSSGNIINPNMELLFKGPTLRDFNFEFRFTPRFQKEAETVRTIIKAFKRNMSPKGSGGTTLRTPNIFEIQYVGDAKNYLNRIKLCALKNVAINYTGDGNWATYNDGSPISMTMRLAFQELTPVYNEDYAAYGNNSDGVGY